MADGGVPGCGQHVGDAVAFARVVERLVAGGAMVGGRVVLADAEGAALGGGGDDADLLTSHSSSPDASPVSGRPEWTQPGWFEVELRAEVQELLALPVGWQLLAALQRIGVPGMGQSCAFPHYAPALSERVGVAGSPCACQVVLVGAWQAVSSWLAGQADAVVVHAVGAEAVQVPLGRDRRFGTVTDPGVEEVAAALRATPVSARNRVHRLRDRYALPELVAAVGDGLVVGWHADVVVADLRDLPDATDRVFVVDQLLARLRERHARGLAGWTLAQIRACLRRLVAGRRDDEQQRREEVQRRRGVQILIDADGGGRVIADLTDTDAAAIGRVLADRARALPDCERSLDQRKADVLVDLLLGGGPGHPAAAGDVAVVIDYPTLIGAAAHPASVPGVGPVPAAVARELAADRTWRLWLTDTAGHVTAVSPRTYRPTADVARLVRAREPHCRFPGCRATVTDLDHVVAFPKGDTTPANLAPTCRRHHRLKTHTRWRQSVTDPDDPSEPPTWTWTSPAGVTYRGETGTPLD